MERRLVQGHTTSELQSSHKEPGHGFLSESSLFSLYLYTLSVGGGISPNSLLAHGQVLKLSEDNRVFSLSLVINAHHSCFNLVNAQSMTFYVM